ncbi:TPA: LOW QUALITY PROTEIN: hypothetical protein N0F65_001620 [Lagenidium giganteum]|uniref:Amino acid permease/ SLC12A domain-containing protein n=1 Tax=Lagenidium giganteum TaxID=4803 RepID=A0AAV2YLP0_9STRA|nr:TPA: LOW QUALITY PROTEIN: hypothetical protein N0F65_001620 [Lagenidium giganteum]
MCFWAYVCFCCCMSEITGALPFAGGAYGLARCTLGFFPAFLIGCCEAIEYITTVASTMLALVNMVVQIKPKWAGSEHVIMLMLYGSILVLHGLGPRVFWIGNIALGVTSLVIWFIYFSASISHVDFHANAVKDGSELFMGGASEFFRVFPFSAWFCLGIEVLNLASDDVANPKSTIPRAQVSCVVTLFVLSIATFLVTVSLPYSGSFTVMAYDPAPLNTGFLLGLGMSVETATALCMPAIYAAAYGLVWSYTKLLHAMASSRLLPPLLAKSTQQGTPYIAMISGTVVSYAVCLVVFYNNSWTSNLLSVGLLFSFMSYTGQCIGYISLKRNYPSIQSSEFKNPFGIAGAVYAMTIWIIGIVCIVFCQGNGGKEIVVFSVIVTIVTAFYHLYSKKRQTFSEQENKVLLVAHVMKFNNKRHHQQATSRVRKLQALLRLKTIQHTQISGHHLAEGRLAEGHRLEAIDHQQFQKTLAIVCQNCILHVLEPTTHTIKWHGHLAPRNHQYFGWNVGHSTGTFGVLISTLAMGTVYMCFCCGVLEITGVLPVAGGLYGLARCTLGFFPAFLIGCCEAIGYIAPVASTMISLAAMVVQFEPSWAGYESVNVGPAEFRANAIGDGLEPLISEAGEFFCAIPFSAWLCLGLEVLNLASDALTHPKTTIPRAQSSSPHIKLLSVPKLASNLVALSIKMALSDNDTHQSTRCSSFIHQATRTSHARGAIDIWFLGITIVFSGQYFGKNVELTAGTYGVLISTVLMGAAYLCFCCCVSEITGVLPFAGGSYGLARCTLGFFPAFLIGCCEAIGYIAHDIITTAAMHHRSQVSSTWCGVCGDDHGHHRQLHRMRCGLKRWCLGIHLAVSWSAFRIHVVDRPISLKLNYPTFHTGEFKNPFGIVGALYAFSVWITGIICLVFCQGSDGKEIIVLSAIEAVVTVFYHRYSTKRQALSEHECKALLVAHVMKFNQKRSATSNRRTRRVPRANPVIIGSGSTDIVASDVSKRGNERQRRIEAIAERASVPSRTEQGARSCRPIRHPPRATMNASDADRQIKQMVNFILQEAHEKANEIRIKTEHDFNLEKQMLVHNAKIKIQEEFTRKEKEREINKRIARSAEIGASRRKKMIARDELLKTLIVDGQSQCRAFTSDENKYKALLRDLIVQGLVKLYESEVAIACRAKDVRLVESVLKEATDKYIAIMKREANQDVSRVKVTLNKQEEAMVPATNSGGVILYAKQGKIVCDNTLDTRLNQVYYDLKPTVRKNLFPSS